MHGPWDELTWVSHLLTSSLSLTGTHVAYSLLAGVVRQPGAMYLRVACVNRRHSQTSLQAVQMLRRTRSEHVHGADHLATVSALVSEPVRIQRQAPKGPFQGETA